MSDVILLSAEEWQRCEVKLLRLRQGPPKEEGRRLECATSDLTAWRLEAGRVEVKTSKCDFHAQAGDWLFLPPGYRRQEFSDDAQLTSLAFLAYWPDSLRPVLDLRPGLLAGAAEGLDRWMDMLREPSLDEPEYEWHFRGICRDFESVLGMESWFRGWLAEAIRLWRQHLPDLEAPRDVDPRVEEARRWLVSQAVDSPLESIDGAARAAGLSAGHLNRLFMHHYHQTLHGFHEQRRLQHARRALLEPDSRIKNVAFELGFRDLSKFSSWFRRLEQMSPRSYRSRMGGG